MATNQETLIAGRYRILGRLGQGGMGRVWRARDELLGREVALKELVPPPGLSAEEQQSMRDPSMREARALARVNHPNAVKIFDVVRPDDGDPWLVMEYVTGRSLQQALDVDGPLPVATVARIGLGVLAALTAGHRAGVVHRDVKPANVLLAADGRVVLTDFGLATVPGDPAVTQTGQHMFGSPAFMAPERALEGIAGTPSDLWSLGATLYAAVEGHPPYPRPTAIATLTALASDPVPPPKRAGALKAVLTGLLRKDPGQRLTTPEAERLLRKAVSKWGVGARGTAVLWSGSAARDSGAPGAGVVPAPVPAPRTPTAIQPPVAPPAPVVAEPVPVGVAPVPAAPTLVERPESRQPGSRRHLGIVVLVAGVCLLAVLVLVPLLVHGTGAPGADPSSSARPSTAPSSAAATPSATASSPAPSPTASGFTLPAGWSMRDDGTGFHVPVPDGWTAGHDSDGRALWRSPDRTRLLLIDQTRQPKPDPLQDWQNNEKARRGGYPDYHRVRLEAVQYWDKAADWEFTYTLNGTPTHVLNRGFITAPDQAYSIYFSTPDAQWSDAAAQLQTILTGFQPARS